MMEVLSGKDVLRALFAEERSLPYDMERTSVQLSSSPSVFSSCVLFGFPCFHGEYFGGGDLR
jgi:hypothetical protein